MKVIDLLNKIAKREEMPKKIIYNGAKYKWCRDIGDYRKDGWGHCLIIKDIFGDFSDPGKHNSLYNMIFDEVEIIEEEKEIEFEDIESFGIHYSWDYIDYKNIEELKKYTNKDFQNIFDTLDKLIKNQKKIIDEINKLKRDNE